MVDVYMKERYSNGDTRGCIGPTVICTQNLVEGVLITLLLEIAIEEWLLQYNILVEYMRSNFP